MTVPAPLGRGRGRGRGVNLPAWMTRGPGAGVGVESNGGRGSGRGDGRGSASGADRREPDVGAPPSRGGDVRGGRGGDPPPDCERHRARSRVGERGGPLERDRDRDRDRNRNVRERGREGERRGPPDRDRDRGRDGPRSRGEERRGYGRDYRERDRERERERDRERERQRERERDREIERERERRSHSDRREDDRGEGRRGDHPPANPVPPQQRHHRGLGYDERAVRENGRDMPLWERDMGMGRVSGRGRGRGCSKEMNFVRGGVVGGDRDDRDSWRDPGDHRGDMGRDRDGMGRRDRDFRETDRGGGNMFRGREGSLGSGIGMGRGAGVGRGRGVNLPSWMTSGAGGPAGLGRGSSPPQEMADSETMERLLAQARQVQKEQTRPNDQRRDVRSQRESKSPSDSCKDGGRRFKASKDQKKEDKLWKEQQSEAEEVAKKVEEEQKRLERQREEEEHRQLQALVSVLSESDKKTDDLSLSGQKRKDGSGDDDDLFEFETEEEMEERLALRRREERRKKMRRLEQMNTGKEEDAKVDRPRNAAGVVLSELNDAVKRQAKKEPMEVDSSQGKEGTSRSTHHNSGTVENDSGKDSFDIFAADNVTPVPASKNAMSNTNTKRNNSTANNAQECDDAEGYYKANIGEIITLPKERRDDYKYSENAQRDGNMVRFRVLGIIGKGVFSSVIKCVEEESAMADRNNGQAGERIVAMKVIRNNEIMAKAAAKEMRILRMLCHKQRPKSSTKLTKSKKESGNTAGPAVEEEEDSEEWERQQRENHNIVRLLDVDPTVSSASASEQYSAAPAYASAPPPEFRNHPVFVFEFLPYNLREVLSKFGKNVGINLTAVRSYARQLLCALGHLERHRVVHADLKPDNILVSANFSTVKLADFGSAFFETDHDNDPTPYLVSRFYRPPEVILGLEYDRMVDLWSAAATLAELFTGNVLFPGKTNNDMLVRFMDAMGSFSHKMVKRHAASYTRMGLQPHFEVGQTGGTYQLRKQDVDRVTGQPVCRLVNVLSAKSESRLAQVLLRASKGEGGALSSGKRVDVLKFADFLNRCLVLDPARRLSVRDALRHDFFFKKKKREDS